MDTIFLGIILVLILLFLLAGYFFKKYKTHHWALYSERDVPVFTELETEGIKEERKKQNKNVVLKHERIKKIIQNKKGL